MCAQTLGDKSPYAADLSVREQEDILPVGRKENLSVRRMLGREEEDASSKVTFIPTQSQEVDVGAGKIPEPRRPRAVPESLSNGSEELLPHLRQPLIYLSLCAGTANNQLKLADFSTFVREPAALAQLSICRKGSRVPEKKSF